MSHHKLSSRPKLSLPERKGKRSGEPALSEVEGDLLLLAATSILKTRST